MYKILGTKIQNFISFLAIDIDYSVIKDWKTEKIENISYFFRKISEILRNLHSLTNILKEIFPIRKYKNKYKFCTYFWKNYEKRKTNKHSNNHFYPFLFIYVYLQTIIPRTRYKTWSQDR